MQNMKNRPECNAFDHYQNFNLKYFYKKVDFTKYLPVFGY